jgi:hypothetical protein
MITSTTKREVTPMGSAPRDDAGTRPFRSDFPNAEIHGGGSLVIGLLALLSPFVTAPIFEHSPVYVFVVGVLLCTASIWLAALAMRAPGGSRGRGMAAAGIVLAILGFAFCLFGWAIGSMLIHDSIL